MGFAPPSQYSPHSGSMSDNNSHGTPAISPGSWNARSPESQQDSPSSAQSRSSSSTSSHTPSYVSSTSTGDYPSLPSELGKVEVIKSDLDTERERLAEKLALRLMDQAVFAKPQVRSGAGALTARQAAAKRSEMQINMAIESKIRYKEEKQKMMPAPKLATPKAKERLATSTRKVKHSPDDSAADFGETVDDMKCQLDREREQWAERTALGLLRLTDRLA